MRISDWSSDVCSSDLPPAARLPGSVGIAAGPEMRILGPDGRFRPAGGEGEIVIRGPNVTAGYENNEKANADGFAADPDGGGVRWFRNGDQGTMDADRKSTRLNSSH